MKLKEILHKDIYILWSVRIIIFLIALNLLLITIVQVTKIFYFQKIMNDAVEMYNYNIQEYLPN